MSLEYVFGCRLKCVSGDENALLGAARFTIRYICLVGQTLAPSKCVLLSTSSAVRESTRGWVLCWMYVILVGTWTLPIVNDLLLWLLGWFSFWLVFGLLWRYLLTLLENCGFFVLSFCLASYMVLRLCCWWWLLLVAVAVAVAVVVVVIVIVVVVVVVVVVVQT